MDLEALNDFMFLCFVGGSLPYQFIALPLGLSSVPWVFTKVLAPVLKLHFHGIHIVGYIDNPLLKEQSARALLNNISLIVQIIVSLDPGPSKILYIFKPTHRLEYLGLVLDTS